MASADRSLSDAPSTSGRKRPHFQPSEPRQQVGDSNTGHRKKKKANPIGAWANLNLILSLQSKDLSIQSKTEIAFDCISSIDDGRDHGREVVQIPRLVSFLIDWVQPHLVSSERSKRNLEHFDPCLDYRCWAILKFCFQKSFVGISPNLLRAFSRVLQHALLQFDNHTSWKGEESDELFKHVFECLSLLLLSNSRAFYNTGIELWVSCSVEVVNLVLKVLTNDEPGPSESKFLLHLSSLLLENFAGFLRFHPNPRNVFRAFVDRLLEPLLELLVLLQLRIDGGKRREDTMLRMVKEVLSNGIFHPAHIGGFLNLRNTNVQQEERQLMRINESYHRHFFQRLEKIVEKKAISLGGYGSLFCLLISRAKSQKIANLSLKVKDASGRHPDTPREAEETSKPLFGIFTQFLVPLMLQCKKCTELDFSQDEELLELRLVEGHCMLKSVNETLASFIDEKIYVPTEDTSEEAHFSFLKEVYNIIISISGKIYKVWLSMLHTDTVRIKRVFCLIAKEIFVAVGYFLEIEYKVVGNELVELWLMIFSYLTVQMPLAAIKPHSLLVSEILKLSCRLINIYSELRQVDIPIFALCKAVRTFTVFSGADSAGNSMFVASSPLSSEMCLQAMATLLSSGTFQVSISSSIKSIPERQANGCIQQLKTDVADSIEWMKHSSLHEGISSDETSILCKSMWGSGLQAEVLGRILSEIYTTVLESLTVVGTNSVLIGNSVEDLMKSIRPSFSNLVQNPSDGFSDFIYSITGQRFSIDELSEHQNKLQNIQRCMAWIFVFFFRMYSSCRSLYRESICLMPPDSAKKASDAMGNLLCVSSGNGWKNNLKSLDDGYFSWMVKPSVSLLYIINSLSELILSSSAPFYAPLVYVLNIMALQRINDLNRMLKAYEFLLEEDSQVSKASLENPDKCKSSKRWNRLIVTSRNEAKELAKFLTGNLPLLASDGKCICSQDFKTCAVTVARVCSLNMNLLPSEIWLLLCRNFDVWCIHASSKDLKMFLSHLLLYSLPCQSGVEELAMDENLLKKVNMHQIAMELINDSILYEQPVLSKNLTSRFCHDLKKSFNFLVNYDSANCKVLFSLSEWSEVLDILVQGPVADMVSGHALPVASSLAAPNGISSDTSSTMHSRSPFHMQLKVCEDLLYLLCRMPGVHVTDTSFSVYLKYILNLERLVMSNMQKNQFDYSTSDRYELLKLFISCRRAIKHLLVAFVDNIESLRSPEFFIVFNHSTILWLLKSVNTLVGLPHAIFGERYLDQIGNMNFALVDHTAYIFLTVSTVLMNYVFQSAVYDEKLQKDDTSEKDPFSLIGQHYETNMNIEVWKLLEILAEIFTNQIGDLTDILQDLKWETDELSILKLNRLSCVVSCLQGFLWGMASISDTTNHITENQQSLEFINSRLFTLRKQMIVFEKFVYSCISTLILKDHEGSEIHLLHKLHHDDSLLRNVAIASLSKCHLHQEQCCVGEKSMPHKQGSSDDQHCRNSAIKKERPSTNHKKWVANAFKAIYGIDLTNLQHLRESCLQGLLDGKSPHSAFMVRQLFFSSAAILKLKCSFLFPNHLESHSECHQLTSKSMVVLLETSHMILQGLTEMVDRPNSFTFTWIDGILKYLEVVGSYISLTDPKRSNDVYCRLIDIHLKCIGKCVSLQGKSAALSCHEMESTTKMLQKQSLYAEERSISELKNQLRLSFRKLIGRPRKLHLMTAVQAIQKALVGMQQDCHVVYEVTIGNGEGGKVSPVVAGGIDCLDLILEYVQEQRQIIKESISSFVVCLFNIVLHLQHPKVFYTEKILYNKTTFNPDAGSVILMCIEILTAIAGKHSFQMDACHASQCLHVPMVLFKDFNHFRDSFDFLLTDTPEEGSLLDLSNHIVDRRFSVDLYSSCCRLLYTTLKHRIREVGQCVSLLQQSVITLANCLEIVGANSLSRKGCFTWDVQEGVKCASFLRRIYEEIRQQKEAIGKYSIYFLSSYISIFSGFGPLRSGIKREIDEALRPGIYSLIDICNTNDIQQLHTALDESSCRATLATLLHDYQLNFQFEGKV